MRKPDPKRQQQLERTRRRNERKKRNSKKKNSRPKRTTTKPEAKSETIVGAVEYYLPAFFDFGETLRRQGYDRGPSRKRQSFWQLIPPGEYRPDQARGYLEAYLQSLEKSLREIIQRNSLAYWLHVYRRFAPSPVGDDKNPTTIQITRAVLDAAIQKYAKTEFCSRIGMSDQVDPAMILRGFLVAHGATEMLKSLATNPQLVLTDFGVDEYREALEIKKLAYEVWRTMAQLRTVGKGAPLVVEHGGEWVADNRSEELDFLVSNFDNRELGFSTSATGTVFGDDLNTEGVIVLPRWNADRVSFRELSPIFEHFLKAPLATPNPWHFPNFVWSPLNISAYYRAHEPFSLSFSKRNGVSLESVIAVIAALVAHLYVVWHRIPLYFLRMWQRAYDAPGKPADIKLWIREFVPIAIKSNGLPFNASAVDVDAAFTYLSLTEESRSQIDISYGGPHAVFIPNGSDQVFIDYAYLLHRLHYLFYGVQLADQNFKGAALEAFTHKGQSALPTGELRAMDGTSRQIDAAFAVDDTLVICECRAVARSIAVEKGEPKALEYRKQLIERTLTDIDEKANWLKAHQTGSNYDVSCYQWVLPIGITPFKEFIHSRDARYWIDEQMPRVLSPGELQGALDDGTLLAASAQSPNRVQIS